MTSGMKAGIRRGSALPPQQFSVRNHPGRTSSRTENGNRIASSREQPKHSMTAHVLPLYPSTGAARALEGLYLEHRLHELGSTAAPFVYGSFVSSLDGRIALDDTNGAADGALKGLTSGN